jgi:polyisoprenoid-binding protein YceI
VWIDSTSITTGDVERDKHLKSVDFLDVLNHKQINFVASTIVKAEEKGKHKLWGELSMIGVTKNVVLDVEFGGIVKDPWGNERAGFTVTGKIKRTDWGLVWNSTVEAGGIMISEEISINCEVEITNIGFKDLNMILESTNVNETTLI